MSSFENNKGQGVSHAADSQNASIVPEKVQQKVWTEHHGTNASIGTIADFSYHRRFQKT
jgi:hypothetical protein